jgi:hypothetical protein
MAAGNTYTPIATNTLSSAASSYTFSSISGSYTDLVLVASFGVTAGDDLWLRFNGDTGGNYSNTRIVGSGGSSSSTRTTSVTGIQPRTPSNQISTITTLWIVNLLDYSNTTTYKNSLSRYGYSAGFTELDVGLWRNTAAITSVSLVCNASTFVSGSTFTLYGIAAA